MNKEMKIAASTSIDKGGMTMTENKSLIITIVFLFVAVLMTGTGFAGDLDPTAAPAPTMKTLDEVEPGIPISSLPFSITSPGSYYLTGNLTSTGNGISINAVDDITIDFRGFTISGPGSSNGVNISLVYSNLEIKNGGIMGFNNGIKGGFNGSQNIRIINMRVHDNTMYGINLTGNRHIVENCNVWDNGYSGIRVLEYSTVRGNIVTGNAEGNASESAIYAKDGSIISDNLVSNNAGMGIRVEGNGHSLIKGNSVSYSGFSGIYVNVASSVIENVVSNSGATGIYAKGSIINNSSFNNGNVGFSSASSIMIGNYASGNTNGSCSGSSCTDPVNTNNKFE